MRAGKNTQVRFTDWICSDDVRTEILAGRALVLPSIAEGLPTMIMEAMTPRRPVLTTDIASIPAGSSPRIRIAIRSILRLKSIRRGSTMQPC
jgi:hypothetical protein